MLDLNFFSPYIKESKISKSKEYMIAAIAVVAAIVVIGFSVNNMMKIKKIEAEIMQMEQFINDKETIEKLADVTEKKKKMEIMNFYYTAVEKINEQINSIDRIDSALFDSIESAMPQDAFLKMVSIAEQEIQLQGIAKNRSTVAELEHNLIELGIFESVHVNMIQEEATESANQSFTMKCTLKDVNRDED
ncbi:MAG: PilN domain-containing protein [Bacillota bacterium]